jgi:hypothetical protein
MKVKRSFAPVAVLVALLLAPPPARGQAAAEAKPPPSGAATAAGAPPPVPGDPTAAPPAPSGATAADDSAPASKAEVKSLAEEVRRLKLEIGLPEPEYRSYQGLGPAASKVYFTPKGLSIGGYGEILYTNYLGSSSTPSFTDLLRLVLYTGYRFSDRILFNAEIEFEHGNTEKGEVAVEFAYVDFLLAEPLSIRLGNVLIPMGFINEVHEPVFFNGVYRPAVERRVIPTTWNENGVGVHGQVSGLRYKGYFLNGLDAAGFTAANWIRGGRQGGALAIAQNFAGVLNLVYENGPFLVGGSIYYGWSGQGLTTPSGGSIQAQVTLGEVHASFTWRSLQIRALYTVGALGQADLVSEALGLTGTQVVGSRVWGAYLEAAFDVLGFFAPSLEMALTPFLRYEGLNLHWQVPAGGTANPALDQRTWTAGLGYKPIPMVVVKADYQYTSTAAGGAALQQANLGLGLVY